MTTGLGVRTGARVVLVGVRVAPVRDADDAVPLVAVRAVAGRTEGVVVVRLAVETGVLGEAVTFAMLFGVVVAVVRLDRGALSEGFAGITGIFAMIQETFQVTKVMYL